MDFYMMGMDKEEREVREKRLVRGPLRPGLPELQHQLREPRRRLQPGRHPARLGGLRQRRLGWNNPTAWLWHAVGPNGDIVTFAEHYQAR
jgi:hypothetical protein